MDENIPELVFFYPAGHQAHYERGHPESPERVERLRQAFEEAGWWHMYPHLEPTMVPDDVLQSVHAPAYLEILQEVSRNGAHLDMDTYTTPASWQLALNAAGGAIAIASAVWRGRGSGSVSVWRITW